MKILGIQILRQLFLSFSTMFTINATRFVSEWSQILFAFLLVRMAPSASTLIDLNLKRKLIWIAFTKMTRSFLSASIENVTNKFGDFRVDGEQ